MRSWPRTTRASAPRAAIRTAPCGPARTPLLDSVRAAQATDFGLAKKFVLVGQSQGAAVVVAAAADATAYAPELDLRGTVATGPNYVTPDNPKKLDPDGVEGDLLAYELLGLHLIGQVDPTFKPDDVVTDRAKPILGLTRTGCLSQVADAIEQDKLTARAAFTVDPKEILAREGVPPRFFTSLKVAKPLFHRHRRQGPRLADRTPAQPVPGLLCGRPRPSSSTCTRTSITAPRSTPRWRTPHRSCARRSPATPSREPAQPTSRVTSGWLVISGRLVRLTALREHGVLLAEGDSPAIRQVPVPVVERPAPNTATTSTAGST